MAKKKVAKKATKKVAKKKATKKVAKKKATKKVAKRKVAKKKATKKVAKKKATKKVAKKKVAKKKATKKVAKKKATKKVAKKKVAKKVAKKKDVKVEKIPSQAPSIAVTKEGYTPDNVDDTLPEVEETPTAKKPSESSDALTAEYNPDDEQEHNAFGYGWSYNKGLDSPEAIEAEAAPYDEDAEYATSGKPAGIALDKTGSSDDDMN